MREEEKSTLFANTRKHTAVNQQLLRCMVEGEYIKITLAVWLTAVRYRGGFLQTTWTKRYAYMFPIQLSDSAHEMIQPNLSTGGRFSITAAHRQAREAGSNMLESHVQCTTSDKCAYM